MTFFKKTSMNIVISCFMSINKSFIKNLYDYTRNNFYPRSERLGYGRNVYLNKTLQLIPITFELRPTKLRSFDKCIKGKIIIEVEAKEKINDRV
jgi:hypothetical protein